MVRIWHFHCHGGSIPGQGTEIPQAGWCGQKKKRNIKSQQKNKSYKEESNKDFRTEKYSSIKKRLSKRVQCQNGRNRGKNQ